MLQKALVELFRVGTIVNYWGLVFLFLPALTFLQQINCLLLQAYQFSKAQHYRRVVIGKL